MTATTPVTCPACFESFEVALPPPGEVPCEVDYDCEVCCRPMVIAFDTAAGFWEGDPGDEVIATARGLGEL